MFKLVVLFAVVAVAQSGYLAGPALPLTYSAAPAVSHVTYAAPAPAHVTYAAAAPLIKTAYAPAPAYTYAAASPAVAVHAPAIGASHESTLRSLDGNSAVSHYSKAVDTAFSSVRKYDTRYTNDAKFIAAAPAFAYAQKTAYVAPAAYGYAAAATPIVAKTTYQAPLAYSPAGVVAHTTFTGLGASYAW
ncbi:larval/pupal cuticle protein H1C-like [Athalia rosae]|uniref:larval/pupal cuticle protein H1C-like n=1 Tax=Athalia rosae TaxID=37344 RepID=UPI0006264625|nr:larval/pupal cuticle protein H1C-like [Athalia rosae]